jgi:hypothetical protein
MSKAYETHDCRTPEQLAAGVKRQVKVIPYTLNFADDEGGGESLDVDCEAWQCGLCGVSGDAEVEDP